MASCETCRWCGNPKAWVPALHPEDGRRVCVECGRACYIAADDRSSTGKLSGSTHTKPKPTRAGKRAN